MLKQYWEKIPNWLKNRYAITSIAFVIWMLFFDSNDAFMLFKLRRELSQIRSEKEYYQQRIEETRIDLENLLNDNQKLEKFAREKYLMKNPDEDIFVIVVKE
jgi:cell division protein FtsB